ncbi:M23 family metallopeptidase [Ruminococcaceae bacterium OttesenSCG-928-A11]|nr:M23 family metallopeptidase [Ruminococcaceae bacterium OttesenSCG-928-A11]
MADLKRKPKMVKPKMKNEDAALPKDARRMLLNEYRAAAGERAGDVRQRPEQDAVNKVEDSMRSVRDHGIAAAKRGMRSLKLRKDEPSVEQEGARSEKTGHRPLGRRNIRQKQDGHNVQRYETHSTSENYTGAESSSVRLCKTKDQMRMDVRREFIKAKQELHHEVHRQGVQHSSERLGSVHKSDGNIADVPGGGKVKVGALKTKDAVGQPGKARAARRQAFRVKTRNSAAAKAKKSAKAARKLKQRTQAVAKAAKKAAVTTAKAVKKVAVAIARAVQAVGKAIIAALGPAGIVVLVFVVIAAVAALINSPFGIFVSGEDEDSKAKMQSTVSAISYEYHEKLKEIIRTNGHDEMRFEYINHGHVRTDNWIDVLTVYACKTAIFGDNGMDVVELDDIRIEKLRAVFWDMVKVTHEVKNEPIYDAETDTSTDHYVLYIRAECISAWTAADSYRFNSDQRDVVGEMLSGAYDEYFNAMIGSAGLFTSLGDGGAVVGNGNFIWPSAASTYVTSAHGTRAHPITGKIETHLGIDIGAGAGTGVLAGDGGTVTRDNIDGSYGIHMLIDHGNGYQTLYAHMSAALVGVGDTVTQGQVIGLVGSTGTSTNPHLHFEVRVNGAHVDPLQFFDNYTTAW